MQDVQVGVSLSGSSFGSRNESLVLNDLAEKGSQSFKQFLGGTTNLANVAHAVPASQLAEAPVRSFRASGELAPCMK